ncbi:MAG: hypothetical protein ACI4I1_12195 [Oscillospiraceae bacterium]
MTDFEQMILQKFENLEKDVEGIKRTLDTDVKSIKLTLENDISPSIKLLSELQLENSKCLINLERDVQELKRRSGN